MMWIFLNFKVLTFVAVTSKNTNKMVENISKDQMFCKPLIMMSLWTGNQNISFNFTGLENFVYDCWVRGRPRNPNANLIHIQNLLVIRWGDIWRSKLIIQIAPYWYLKEFTTVSGGDGTENKYNESFVIKILLRPEPIWHLYIIMQGGSENIWPPGNDN